MFAVEGWKLGQLVRQSLPERKRKKRKREGNEDQASADSRPLKFPRTNPFSMRTDTGSMNKLFNVQVTEDMKDNLPSNNSKAEIRGDGAENRKSSKATKVEKRLKQKWTKTSGERPLPSSPQPKSPAQSQQSAKLTSLQEKMKAKLAGSHFRHINETLYTTDSSKALTLFTEQPSLFHDVLTLMTCYLT